MHIEMGDDLFVAYYYVVKYFILNINTGIPTLKVDFSPK